MTEAPKPVKLRKAESETSRMMQMALPQTAPTKNLGHSESGPYTDQSLEKPADTERGQG